MLIGLLLFALAGVSQVPPILPTSETGQVQFRQVVSLGDSARAPKQLAQQARTWVAKAFKSANSVIQQFDPEQGSLIVKGSSQISYSVRTTSLGRTMETPVNYRLDFMLTIETKPGRYRATIEQLTMHTPPMQGMSAMDTPVTAARQSEEETYQSVQAAAGSGMLSEKAKRTIARESVEGQTRSQEQIRDACLSLLADLKAYMKQTVKADKDW